MGKKLERKADLRQITIQDSFWSYYQNLIQNVVIPYQEKILKDEIPGIEKSHAIENFRAAAGESGEEYYGMVFQDSDLAKWMEASAYAIALGGNPKIQKSLEEVIEIVKKAQQEDGYLDTYFILKEPEKRWENLLECHELYCMGHLIEAAVAYYEVTGKDDFLMTAKKMADHIDSRFGPGKIRGIPGHEEIELALLRLYDVTGEIRYRDLAAYFLNERGTEPNYFEEEGKKRNWSHWPMDPLDRKYAQNHKPVREQRTAEGHSVRAMYLYTAMAALAKETDDAALFEACREIFENAVNKRMYLTGGLGSTVDGEAFTIDYDLPNDMAYAETCASIGMVFFARNMLETEQDGRYGDIMEKELYNGILSGIQHDGSRFFYVNPLEVVPGVSGKLFGYRHDLPKRPPWYACACCPPNVSRLVASLGKYIWGESMDGEILYSHLFVGGTIVSDACGMEVNLTTEYPWEEEVCYTIQRVWGKAEKTLAIRIPGWCTEYTLAVNGKQQAAEGLIRQGYLYLAGNFKEGDSVSLKFSMPVVQMYANEGVRKDAGCTAIVRGPVVYCLEEADNGRNLHGIHLPDDASFTEKREESPEIGRHVAIEAAGYREKTDERLYSSRKPEKVPVTIYAVPYHLWGNRGEGEMRVWILRG